MKCSRRIAFAAGVCGAFLSLNGGTRTMAAEPTPAASDAIAIVRAHVAAFNRHDAGALAERVAPDFVYYNVTSDATTVETKGREALREGMLSYFKSFPDVRSEIEGVQQTGPFVSFRERATWTSAKGEKTQSALAIYEVHDGVITRVWYYPAAK